MAALARPNFVGAKRSKWPAEAGIHISAKRPPVNAIFKADCRIFGGAFWTSVWKGVLAAFRVLREALISAETSLGSAQRASRRGALPHALACCARPPTARRRTASTRSTRALDRCRGTVFEGVRRPCGSGVPAGGRWARAAGGSVRHGAPDGRCAGRLQGWFPSQWAPREGRETPPEHPSKQTSKTHHQKCGNQV